MGVYLTFRPVASLVRALGFTRPVPSQGPIRPNMLTTPQYPNPLHHKDLRFTVPCYNPSDRPVTGVRGLSVGDLSG